MTFLFVLLWLFLLFATPIAFLLVAGKCYGRDDFSKIIGKFLVSLFFYLMSSVISYLFLQEAAGFADLRHGEMDSTGKIIALSTIYFYGFVGYLLCSFINGNFLKPWKVALFNSKKPQSIFNK